MGGLQENGSAAVGRGSLKFPECTANGQLSLSDIFKASYIELVKNQPGCGGRSCQFGFSSNPNWLSL